MKTKKALIVMLVSALFIVVSISACSDRVDILGDSAIGSEGDVGGSMGDSPGNLDNAEGSADSGDNGVRASDASYVLPPEVDFCSFIEIRLYEEINSGRLLLNTALERPVELDVVKYHLPGSAPEIHVNAIVFEEDVGIENGKDITRQVVEIMLEWLDSEGFEPFGTFMMPISYVYMETIDEAGNHKEIVWGNSIYNPFTGVIE